MFSHLGSLYFFRLKSRARFSKLPFLFQSLKASISNLCKPYITSRKLHIFKITVNPFWSEIFLPLSFHKSICQNFAAFFVDRNLQLKKIKRTEKKGTESVMDEKFSVLFWTEFQVGELKFQVKKVEKWLKRSSFFGTHSTVGPRCMSLRYPSFQKLRR